MPGINKQGLPLTDDYTIPRAICLISELNANNDRPVSYRDLGNCPEASISVESEKREHKSSRQGISVTDKTIEVGRTVSLNLTMDESSFQNLALYLAGTVHDDIDNFTLDVNSTTPVVNYQIGPQGRWYDLYKYAALAEVANPNSHTFRIYNPASVIIAPSTGSPYILNTHYTLDLIAGRFFVPYKVEADGSPTPGFIEPDEQLKISLTQPAPALDTVQRVKMFQATAKPVALKLIEISPAAADHITEWQFHKVSFTPNGDLGLISEDIRTIPLSGTIEPAPNVDASSPYGSVTTYPTAHS